MVIYGNNLAEKLFGIAISRDYLRYATPYCDLVEDPDFAVDIDLAVSFNRALEGDMNAGRRCVETLILNSSMLDWSTIDFYVDKMEVHPYFQDEIRRINDIFNDPNYPNFKYTGGAGGTGAGGAGGTDDVGGIGRDSDIDDDYNFLDALKDAAQDCINSPCNVFAATSDSVGRLAQAASTKTSENTFDLGSLAGAATNLINGLDQTIFNSIPAAFQQGIVGVTAAAKQSWTNAQAVFMGGDIETAANMATDTGSMRSSTDKIFSFSPDIKSFFDFDAMGATILSEVANNIGGCFDKFQNAYRYNPYTDNMSTPLGYGTSQVNGVPYSHDPGGVYSVVGMSRAASGDCSQFVGGPGSVGGSGVELGGGTKLIGESYYISLPLVQRTETGKVYSTHDGWPFMVGSYINQESTPKTIIRAISLNTDAGKDIIPGINLCPGVALATGDSRWIKSADSTLEREALTEEEQLEDKPLIVNLISNGWKHKIDATGMTEPQKNPIFDDGAIINKMLTDRVKVFVGKPDELPVQDIIEGIRDNKVFLVIRQANKCAKIVRVIGYDANGSYNQPVFGLTPAAYKYVYEKDPKGAKDDAVSDKKAVKEAGWEVYNAAVVHTGDTEVRVALGDYKSIKDAVDAEIGCSNIEVGDCSGWITNIDSKKAQSIDKRLLNILCNMGKNTGNKLTITSGYRDPVYNAKVGGAKNSAHTRKYAVDISGGGLSETQKLLLIKEAHKYGILGIGVYNSSLHFDIDTILGKRAWGPSYKAPSIPYWARKTLLDLKYI